MTAIKGKNESELRKFGLLIGSTAAVLFGLLLPWLRNTAYPVWPWIIAAFFWLFALLMPGKLRGFHRSWMRIGSVIGRFNTSIVLGLFYYLIMTPLALFMRLGGRDPLSKKIERNAQTYRVRHQQHKKLTMEAPF